MVLVIDLFIHKLAVFDFGLSFSPNSISKTLMLYLAIVYLIYSSRCIKKLALSPITIFPLLCFNRELIELKTFSFTYSLFEIYLFVIIFIIGVVSFTETFPRKKIVDRLVFYIFMLLFIGFIQVLFHNKPENTNGFFITYFYPLIYFCVISTMDLGIRDVRHSLFTMFCLSMFIFILQNIYIGPIVVYRSSVEQSWLTQNISIANGGLLEIGAMEVFLMPIAFYVLWNFNELKIIYSKTYMYILLFFSVFLMAMPFIYHNRANSLVVLSFLFLYIFSKFSYKKITLYLFSIIPFMMLFIYKMVVSRSFVSGGKEINIFGFAVNGIDSTTFDHLESTMVGFSYLMHNIMFGVGLLTGVNSDNIQSIHTIGNMRNFILPIIEVAINMGGVFFIFYLIMIYQIYRATSDNLMKYLLLLQFFPVVGASKFFSAYATGHFDIRTGFYSLSDFSPIAITSFFCVYVYLLCTIKAKEN